MQGVIPTTPLERGSFTESAFGYTFFAVLVGGGGIWVEWCSGIGMELVNGGCGCSGETWVKLGLFF